MNFVFSWKFRDRPDLASFILDLVDERNRHSSQHGGGSITYSEAVDERGWRKVAVTMAGDTPQDETQASAFKFLVMARNDEARRRMQATRH